MFSKTARIIPAPYRFGGMPDDELRAMFSQALESLADAQGLLVDYYIDNDATGCAAVLGIVENKIERLQQMLEAATSRNMSIYENREG